MFRSVKSTGPVAGRLGQGKPATVRYKKPRRIKKFCEDTGVSRPTAWRWIGEGILLREYAGDMPFIVGGPPMFDDPPAA